MTCVTHFNITNFTTVLFSGNRLVGTELKYQTVKNQDLIFDTVQSLKLNSQAGGYLCYSQKVTSLGIVLTA